MYNVEARDSTWQLISGQKRHSNNGVSIKIMLHQKALEYSQKILMFDC